MSAINTAYFFKACCDLFHCDRLNNFQDKKKNNDVEMEKDSSFIFIHRFYFLIVFI